MKLKSLKTTNQLITMVLCFAIALATISCSGSQSGTYVSEKNEKNYIELKSDGTFFLKEGSMSAHGKYETDGKEITLKMDLGLAAKGKIEGDVFIDKDGDRWVKNK